METYFDEEIGTEIFGELTDEFFFSFLLSLNSLKLLLLVLVVIVVLFLIGI
jgi:hypothetical protein